MGIYQERSKEAQNTGYLGCDCKTNTEDREHVFPLQNFEENRETDKNISFLISVLKRRRKPTEYFEREEKSPRTLDV